MSRWWYLCKLRTIFWSLSHIYSLYIYIYIYISFYLYLSLAEPPQYLTNFSVSLSPIQIYILYFISISKNLEAFAKKSLNTPLLIGGGGGRGIPVVEFFIDWAGFGYFLVYLGLIFKMRRKYSYGFGCPFRENLVFWQKASLAIFQQKITFDIIQLKFHLYVQMIICSVL